MQRKLFLTLFLGNTMKKNDQLTFDEYLKERDERPGPFGISRKQLREQFQKWAEAPMLPPEPLIMSRQTYEELVKYVMNPPTQFRKAKKRQKKKRNGKRRKK